MKKIIYSFLLLSFFSCKRELDLKPFDKLSPATAFNTGEDLQLYANSFYLILPTGNDIVRGDAMSDFLVGKTASAYLTENFSSTQASGWNWGDLRNINYFLEHYQQAQVNEETRNHYAGLARFFRAWFYFDMLKKFGDVPWYNKAMDVSDPDLYKARDPRTLVVDSILTDLNFACDHIRSQKDNSCSQITKWVALAFKSRFCLFEGTFRKYHTELNLSSTADQFLNDAATAAKAVMDGKLYKLNTGSPAELSYRNLFINETPNATEVLLAAVNNKELQVFNDANWYWTSATYGARLSFIKTYIDTYLMRDGSRFTDQPQFDTIPFWDEVKNRDLRLQQSIRLGNYSREGAPSPPDFTYTYTGYQPLKFTVDSKSTDGVAQNFNSLPILRYAEVLLNYAEARAELGLFDQADWDATIKLLRNRAGITNTAFPTVADAYLQAHYFPGISNPALLEIRRERGIELCMEGFRYDDLKRWKLGRLLEQPYSGMYVPAMDVLYDLNEDGKPEVSFVHAIPSAKVPGVYYFLIDNKDFALSEGDKGNLIIIDNLQRSYDDFKYFYPIPFNEIVLNPNLIQNPGWD